MKNRALLFAVQPQAERRARQPPAHAPEFCAGEQWDDDGMDGARCGGVCGLCDGGRARKGREAKILTAEKELQIIALFPLVQIITLAWLCRQIITVARRTGNQDYIIEL